MKYLSTYKLFESVNQADQIALQEVYGAETVMSFEFNRENITDTDDIKDLIAKYNYYCIKEDSWSGGPPPHGFIRFFNKEYSEKKNASRGCWYPTINLEIKTKRYGSIIMGYSLSTKEQVLSSFRNLKVPNLEQEEFEIEVKVEILSLFGEFISKDKGKNTIYDIIDQLDLNVTNYVNWEWSKNTKL